jgi:UDP-N-acetylglucosamine acyltransferase
MNIQKNSPLISDLLFEDGFFTSSETYVHPTSYVGPQVTLGAGVKIGPFCTIVGNVVIGDNTRLYGNVVVGMPAEDINTPKPLGAVVIGANCHIREFVSINASKYVDGFTRIGDNCYIMNFCYVSHDATLENNVIMINSVNLGGHVYIEHHAVLMANSALHQFCRVGAYTAIAAFTATGQDLPPFSTFSGRPASFSGLNRVGLRRNSFNQQDLNDLRHLTKLFFQDKLMLPDIQQLAAREPWGSNPHVQTFLTFVSNSRRGVSRRRLGDNARHGADTASEE